MHPTYITRFLRISSGNSPCVTTCACAVLQSKFTSIDGFYALEGSGPTSGTPVQLDLLIAGKDTVATDATACRVMDIDPVNIYHIERAYEKGFGEMDEARINVVGSRIDEVNRHSKRSWEMLKRT